MLIMINIFVLLICVDGGRFFNFVKIIGKIVIVVRKIDFIKVKWYKIFVRYCFVFLFGWIFGIYLFCLFRFFDICFGLIWINV